tara:strand:- start:90 stop:1013 length:924 start_codon:yes stop_codon:yes gene_type:complete
VKILVISSNLIGDTILSTGVIKYFSYKNPEAKFTFVIGPSAKSIFKNFKSVENIITISKKKYNMHWVDIISNCYGKKWDIIIDFRSSLLSYFLKHKKKIIFKKKSNLNHVHQLSNYFGFDCSDLFIETNNEEEEIVTKDLSNNFKYFVIFPGGNWEPKIWSIKNYNSLLVKILSQNTNIKFILVGSKAEEEVYLNEITKNIDRNNIINLFGTSLTQTAAYMKKSNLFIGNDSGLSHMASATKLKSIVLFGPTNDIIYGPIMEDSQVIRTNESYDYFKSINIDKTKSYMDSITVEKIYNILQKNNYCE